MKFRRAMTSRVGAPGLLLSAFVLALPSSAPAARLEPIEKSRVSAEAFSAEMAAAGPYAAGKEGLAIVTVSAKGEFKINQQFPFRLKLGEAPEGVTYPKSVLKRDDGAFTEKQAVFKFPFVAQKPGKYVLSGTVSISVCNDKKCLMEKVPLDVEVTVQ